MWHSSSGTQPFATDPCVIRIKSTFFFTSLAARSSVRLAVRLAVRLGVPKTGPIAALPRSPFAPLTPVSVRLAAPISGPIAALPRPPCAMAPMRQDPHAPCPVAPLISDQSFFFRYFFVELRWVRCCQGTQ